MPKKILICDDEKEIVNVVAKRLSARGYDVTLAVDGIQSVAAAHREKPDLILLDIKMPGGDGFSVYENLQRSTNTQLIPVIIFSALPRAQVEEKCRQLGVADYVPKPFDVDELFAKVEKAIGKG